MEKYRGHFHIPHFLKSSYNELLISNTFRNFGLSLVSLFLPIYLLKKGFSLESIVLFELALLISSLIFHFIYNKVISEIGIKKTLILSYILTIAFYYFLNKTDAVVPITGKGLYLFLLAMLATLYSTPYWLGYHYYFIKATSESKHQGKRLGLLVSLPIFLSIASPLVGGLWITKFGFELTFVVVIMMTAIGAACLLFTEEIHFPVHTSMRHILAFNKPKRNFLYFIEGTNNVATGFAWPVLLYLINIKIIMMGALYSLTHAIYATVSYVSGKLTDKHGPRKMILFGSIGHGISLILRAVSKTMIFVTSFQSLGGIFSPLWRIPLHASFYKRSKLNSANSVMNREFYQHLGRIATFAIILLAMVFFDPVKAFIGAIIGTGILTFLLTFLIEDLN